MHAATERRAADFALPAGNYSQSTRYRKPTPSNRKIIPRVLRMNVKPKGLQVAVRRRRRLFDVFHDASNTEEYKGLQYSVASKFFSFSLSHGTTYQLTWCRP